eukprot:9721942-Karenia_brevis.AAC.1
MSRKTKARLLKAQKATTGEEQHEAKYFVSGVWGPGNALYCTHDFCGTKDFGNIDQQCNIEAME